MKVTLVTCTCPNRSTYGMWSQCDLCGFLYHPSEPARAAKKPSCNNSLCHSESQGPIDYLYLRARGAGTAFRSSTLQNPFSGALGRHDGQE